MGIFSPVTWSNPTRMEWWLWTKSYNQCENENEQFISEELWDGVLNNEGDFWIAVFFFCMNYANIAVNYMGPWPRTLNSLYGAMKIFLKF